MYVKPVLNLKCYSSISVYTAFGCLSRSTQISLNHIPIFSLQTGMSTCIKSQPVLTGCIVKYVDRLCHIMLPFMHRFQHGAWHHFEVHSQHFSFTLFHTFVILYYLSTSCGSLMIWPASQKEWHPLKNIQVRLVLHILYHVLGLKYRLSFFKPLSVIGPIFKHVLNIWCVCSIIHIKDHSVSVQEKLASGLL